jgi:hypothetical protein
MKALHEQYRIMTSFQDHVEKDDMMPAEVAELLFSKPMTKLYQSLATVLNDNNIIAVGDSQPEQ